MQAVNSSDTFIPTYQNYMVYEDCTVIQFPVLYDFKGKVILLQARCDPEGG